MLGAEFMAHDGFCESLEGQTEHLSLVFPFLLILESCGLVLMCLWDQHPSTGNSSVLGAGRREVQLSHDPLPPICDPTQDKVVTLTQ